MDNPGFLPLVLQGLKKKLTCRTSAMGQMIHMHFDVHLLVEVLLYKRF